MLPLLPILYKPIWGANPSQPLTVVVGLTFSKQLAVSRYDFGSCSGFNSAPLNHVFLYQNPTPLSQTITELRPACGCTSALLGENIRVPLTLLPDQTVSVRVTLDPAHLPPGPITKAVWVYIKGQAAPAATLEMTGTMLPMASLAPTALNFGPRTFGSSPTFPLKVTWNKSALPSGSQCQLVSTNLEVKIALELPEADEAAADNPPQTYQCTLSPQAHLGEVGGSVEAVVTVPGSGPVVVGAAPIQGDVRGDVAATPGIAAFGTVTRGQAASRQITLTLRQPGTLTVSSVSPFLTTQLHLMTPTQEAKPFGATAPLVSSSQTNGRASVASQALLNITLSGNTPTGPLETELTVTTQSGQRLRVPVFVMVTSPEAKS